MARSNMAIMRAGRTSRDWSRTDGTLISESYTYDAATARLMGVSLDDGAGNMSPLRDFSYNASGQLVADTRTSGTSENIYSYGINARGRMTSVSLGGVEIAAYTYDESEQRIVKAANGNTTHYHYDLEGRLIAETDGTTGETLREYVWLGLMPIAVIAPTEAPPEGECNRALIEALEVELATAAAAADALQSQILDWDGNIAFREAKIAEMRAQLETLSGKKREKLEAKIARWESLISSTEAKVTEAETELAAINTQIADIDTALTEQQAICDGITPTLGTGTFYLHADHLGRPQFATDSDGVVVWDMGEGVTPFGQGVNLAGAFAQRLMFPGQYADEETGEEIVLSHNWHRTYDPTLGRYLQSDPIGLAGGLNRYAYVGGNPVSWVDPKGLDSPPHWFATHGDLKVYPGAPEVFWMGDYKTKDGKLAYKCGYGTPPKDPHLDIDFVKINGKWQKLKSGKLKVRSIDDIYVHSLLWRFMDLVVDPPSDSGTRKWLRGLSSFEGCECLEEDFK